MTQLTPLIESLTLSSPSSSPALRPKVYVVIPAGLVDELSSALTACEHLESPSLWSRTCCGKLRFVRRVCWVRLRLQLVYSWWPHLSMEDPPRSVNQAALQVLRVERTHTYKRLWKSRRCDVR